MGYILFLGALLFANSVYAAPGFFCKSNQWSTIESYDQVMQISTCLTVPRRNLFYSKKAALRNCEIWANERNLNSNFELKYFEELKDCKTFHHQIVNELDLHHFNRIKYLESHTRMGFTRVYFNQISGQTPILNDDGEEQAQWIKRGELFYCGFVNRNVAFYTDLGILEVLNLATDEKKWFFFNPEGYYERTEDDGKYYRADFEMDLNKSSYISIYQIENGLKKQTEEFDITYMNWDSQVTPSTCY